MYLAIGFSDEHEGFCASRDTTSTDAQEVANHLQSEFGVCFEQILLVKNDTDCPSVVYHWNLDRDYQEA